MLFYGIILGAYVLTETVCLLCRIRSKNRMRRRISRSLYRLVEEETLNLTLKNRITVEQASLLEQQKIFLQVTFPDTKPLAAWIFSLDRCLTIGRSRENRICIRDDMLSRVHCKISLVNHALILQDMGTANGTRIRRGLWGKMDVLPQRQEVIFSGDRLEIGNYRMKLQIRYGWEADI